MRSTSASRVARSDSLAPRSFICSTFTARVIALAWTIDGSCSNGFSGAAFAATSMFW
jgi:hypothetical protein